MTKSEKKVTNTRGTHDGLGFFACLVLLGICVALGNDLQEQDTRAATPKAQAHIVHPPQRKPPVPEIAGVHAVESIMIDMKVLTCPKAWKSCQGINR